MHAPTLPNMIRAEASLYNTAKRGDDKAKMTRRRRIRIPVWFLRGPGSGRGDRRPVTLAQQESCRVARNCASAAPFR